MSKSVNKLLGVMVGVGALVGVASSAQAHHWGHGCSGCGPQPTQHSYKDVYTHSNVYHHTNEYHHYPVYIPRLTVYVTRVHPSVTVHNMVTIHQQPYPVIVDHSKIEMVTLAKTYKYETVTTTVHEPCGCYAPVCHKH